MNDGFMTKREAAAFLGVALNTLDKTDIPRLKIGARRILFRRADIEKWIEEHARVQIPAWAAKE